MTWLCGVSQYTLQVWHDLAHGLTHRRVKPFRKENGLVTRACGCLCDQFRELHGVRHELGHGNVIPF
ncbi:Argininosuccinate lyase [Gossypium arboreum]|uniref:Argininosuccinate lyase n=1 Tax=Gossypium arboreum TaxID=29729 RepID=A0A0B0MX81_GOSAR|nr:Argininosuccinate lyase [Gossypium arboreum]